jgi:Tfp pilus assembly ATPase PilU
MYRLNDLLRLVEAEGGEELRLEPDKSPVMVVRGQPRAIDVPALTSDNVKEFLRNFATEEQMEELRRCGDVHFNCTFEHSVRFSVSATMERESITLRMRRPGR